MNSNFPRDDSKIPVDEQSQGVSPLLRAEAETLAKLLEQQSFVGLGRCCRVHKSLIPGALQHLFRIPRGFTHFQCFVEHMERSSKAWNERINPAQQPGRGISLRCFRVVTGKIKWENLHGKIKKKNKGVNRDLGKEREAESRTEKPTQVFTGN